MLFLGVENVATNYECGVPTLVVCGEHDPISPPVIGRRLAGAIPGARLEVVEGASHGVTIHRPETINAMLAEHLRAAETRWQAAQPPAGEPGAAAASSASAASSQAPNSR